MLVSDGDRRVTDEGRVSGDHLVEHASQGVHVGTRIDRLAPGLFRRQILRGADHRRGLGDPVIAVSQRTRDSEVHHFDRTGVGDHDVGGLHVAVNDSVLMTEVQGLAGIGDDL